MVTASPVPRPESYRMPQWTLNCQNCKKIFRHSQIAPRPDILLYDPLWPYRPELPEGGANFTLSTLPRVRYIPTLSTRVLARITICVNVVLATIMFEGFYRVKFPFHMWFIPPSQT